MSERKKLTAYDRLLLARDPARPNVKEYIKVLFDNFVELHGDRLFRDDPAIIGGIATFHDMPVTVIGHLKGRNTEENVKCNFGMASPEGYRKARRLMEQAEKFQRPVITIIDTPGAYPGMEAESNGQSNAIAENLAVMSRLKVPVVAVVTGEGSSGGALALAVADKVWMLENAVYSILSPEGFASIMWKDASRAPEAADIMKITAKELKDYGLIDDIIPEGKRGFVALDTMLYDTLSKLRRVSPAELAQSRYRKFRKIDGMTGLNLRDGVSGPNGNARLNVRD
ncbi:MAG: acetyl-CoA carboxylase carboxyltransferase subunit alpha [Lachnospiraceae bacterium]|nr:acetyl-CoA carboxylase carboxyltransferase subunit alpha [Lachnospiraceae bacterium]